LDSKQIYKNLTFLLDQFGPVSILLFSEEFKNCC